MIRNLHKNDQKFTQAKSLKSLHREFLSDFYGFFTLSLVLAAKPRFSKILTVCD